ncbi:12244_t:CDS:1, partial [Gigaspora margarita]
SDDSYYIEEDKTTRRTNESLEENKYLGEEEQKWETLISEWIEFGKHEHQFENKDDEILLSSEWDSDFSLEGREKHPADDETAKWPLDSLFVFSLEMPLYFDSEITNF